MKTETDIQLRLQHMTENSPNGGDALRLLSRLTVFQGRFPRAAVIAMTPQDMSDVQRIDAFATLGQWRLVHKVSQRRYEIPAALRALLPPSHEASLRALEYWIQLLITQRSTVLYLYWEDIASAIVWGLQNHPDKIQNMTVSLPSHLAWWFKQEWALIFKGLEQVALSDTPAEGWKEHVLTEYIDNAAQPSTQLIRMIQRADAAVSNQNLRLARQHYEQSLTLARSLTTHLPPPQWWWLHQWTLKGLMDVLVHQHDIAAVYPYADEFLTLIQNNSYALHQLGVIMAKINDRSAARDCFSRALQVTEAARNQAYRASRVYRDWARLERNSHRQLAVMLHQHALSQALRDIDLMSDSEHRPHLEEAWYNFNVLTREWQKLASI